METEKITFSERVYAFCRKIPRGKVTTYKEIARALGGKGQSYRAVGRALRENPYAPSVPCHRVVCSSGAVGGFKGNTTSRFVQQKINLLTKEGVKIRENKVDLLKFLYRF